MTTLTPAQISLLTQAKDRCYPGTIDSEDGYWITTLAGYGFKVADYPDLPALRDAIDAAIAAPTGCSHTLPTDQRGLSDAVCPTCEGEMERDLTDEDWATPETTLQKLKAKLKAAQDALRLVRQVSLNGIDIRGIEQLPDGRYLWQVVEDAL